MGLQVSVPKYSVNLKYSRFKRTAGACFKWPETVRKMNRAYLFLVLVCDLFVAESLARFQNAIANKKR